MPEPMEKLLEVKHLKKYFNVKKGKLHAVDDLSFHIYKGETLGLVGESGCGKSTNGRTLIRLIPADAGEILFHGENILDYDKRRLHELRSKMQMVFQDPYSSLDPRKNLLEIISEPLTNLAEFRQKSKKEERVLELMDVVGLSSRLISAYPHELDGGRRQRVGVARALSVRPEFIALDEPVSALDVCIQAQIINLLKRLQRDLGLSYLFISHDLSVVKHISNRIAVMYVGKIVELSDSKSIFVNPLHPYTQALLSAIPIPKSDTHVEEIILKGDVPSPVNPPPGCRFAGRCIYAQKICWHETPELEAYTPDHMVACHFAGKLQRTVVEHE